MHQHPSASLRSVVLMAPPSFQPWLIPTTIPSGIPASASESRICPTLTGQYRYGPVTQPHECDAHIPPLPPCHPRHAGQWSYLHRQQDPETGTPRSSVGPPRFHAPVHGPSPAIRGVSCHGQSRTFPADHPGPPSIPTVTTSARCRISSRLTRLPCCSRNPHPPSGQNAGQDQFPHWHVLT